MSVAQSTRTCHVCQKPVKQKRSKFCSRACQGISKRGTDKLLKRSCPVCGTAFLSQPSEVARGGGVYCSRECFCKGNSRPEADRFWEKVNKDGPTPAHRPELGPCWLWTAGGKGGQWDYGILGGHLRGMTPKLAHRVSWELHHGPIPEGGNVLHHCDTPRCVRPGHLFLGTLSDNTQDMLRKRRHLVKLTDERVTDLRDRYDGGGVSQTELAEEFGISQSTVSRIILHRNTY